MHIEINRNRHGKNYVLHWLEIKYDLINVYAVNEWPDRHDPDDVDTEILYRDLDGIEHTKWVAGFSLSEILGISSWQQ